MRTDGRAFRYGMNATLGAAARPLKSLMKRASLPQCSASMSRSSCGSPSAEGTRSSSR